MGPAEVLLPYVVKNELHTSAGDLGLVFAAGGIGAIGAALTMGQRGHPRRDVTFMYATWTLATLAMAGYGLATASWQLMVACLLFNALRQRGPSLGDDQAAPRPGLDARAGIESRLASRSASSRSLRADGSGRRPRRSPRYLIGAAVIGGVVTLGALFLPGMRDIEGLRRRNEAGGRSARESRPPQAACLRRLLRRPLFLLDVRCLRALTLSESPARCTAGGRAGTATAVSSSEAWIRHDESVRHGGGPSVPEKSMVPSGGS